MDYIITANAKSAARLSRRGVVSVPVIGGHLHHIVSPDPKHNRSFPYGVMSLQNVHDVSRRVMQWVTGKCIWLPQRIS